MQIKHTISNENIIYRPNYYLHVYISYFHKLKTILIYSPIYDNVIISMIHSRLKAFYQPVYNNFKILTYSNVKFCRRKVLVKILILLIIILLIKIIGNLSSLNSRLKKFHQNSLITVLRSFYSIY